MARRAGIWMMPALTAALLVGCTDPATTPYRSTTSVARRTSAPSSPERQRLAVVATYIPACPSAPTTTTDPSCARQALVGIEVTATSTNSAFAVTVSTGADGSAQFSLEPGDYSISGGPATNGAITPSPVHVTIGSVEPEAVTLLYASSFQ